LLSTTKIRVTIDSDSKRISKAYKKKVLNCHPDKFPGDAAKAALFQRVKAAYDILSNDVERAKYDAIQRGLATRKRKIESEDVGRQKMREDLDRKEKLHKDKIDLNKRKAEEDLIKQQDAELIAQLNRDGKLQSPSSVPVVPPAEDDNAILVKWSTGELSERALRSIFEVYGIIKYIGKQKNSALVEFISPLSAEKACSHTESEWNFSISVLGKKGNVNSSPSPSPLPKTNSSSSSSTFQTPISRKPSRKAAFNVASPISQTPSSSLDQDEYEKQILARLQEFGQKQKQKDSAVGT